MSMISNDTYVRGSTVRLDAISPISPSQPSATDLIPVIRSLEDSGQIEVQRGGEADELIA